MKKYIDKRIDPRRKKVKNHDTQKIKKGETVDFRTGVTWDAQKTEESTMYEILGYL